MASFRSFDPGTSLPSPFRARPAKPFTAKLATLAGFWDTISNKMTRRVCLILVTLYTLAIVTLTEGDSVEGGQGLGEAMLSQGLSSEGSRRRGFGRRGLLDPRSYLMTSGSMSSSQVQVGGIAPTKNMETHDENEKVGEAQRKEEAEKMNERFNDARTARKRALEDEKRALEDEKAARATRKAVEVEEAHKKEEAEKLHEKFNAAKTAKRALEDEKRALEDEKAARATRKGEKRWSQSSTIGAGEDTIERAATIERAKERIRQAERLHSQRMAARSEL